MINFFKKSPVYWLIRKYKSQVLDANYKQLVKELFFSSNILDAPQKKVDVIPISPIVLGVGHLDWERYGFWKTFEEKFDFSFFELESSIKIFSAQIQSEIARNILHTIEKLIATKGRIDFIFFYCDASYLSESLLKTLKDMNIKTVMMGLDDKHRYRKHKVNDVFGGQELMIPYIDFYWSTWKSLVLNIKSKGKKAIYLAEGADPDFHKRDSSIIKDIDVLFLGNAYGARKEIVDFLVANDVNVETFGFGWKNGFISFEETIKLYNRSKIVLGVGGVGHSTQFKHLKGRDFEATMCGCFYITTYNPELADWFEIGREIVCYSSYLELLEQINYYLKYDKEREAIAESAYKRSIAEHTWNHRLNSLLTEMYEIT